MRSNVVLVLVICSCLTHGAVLPAERLHHMSMPHLIDSLDTASVQTRRDIEDILLDNIPAVTGVLRDKLTTGSTKEKLFACSFIGMVQDANSLDDLLTAIDDTDPKVQTRAILTIGNIRGKSTVGRIRQKLTLADNTTIIKASLVSIGRIGGTSDVSLLQRFLAHDDESVRCDAAGAMALLGNYQGQDILLECTYSDNPAVQKEATYCLGFINTPASREKLEQILDDPAGKWKSYARIAIAQQEIDNVNEMDKVGLLKALTEDSTNKRLSAWAVDRLAELNDRQSREILQKIAESENHLSRKARLTLKARRRK